MPESVRRFFDNPVYRFLYSRSYVRNELRGWAAIPVGFLILLMGVYQIYNYVFTSYVSMGTLVFLLLSAIYIGACCVYGLMGAFMDPVINSTKFQVADQVIMTGISPSTWLAGHLLFCIVSWLFITGLLLPYMCLCWLLGDVSLLLPFQISLIGLVFLVTLRLCTLLCFRAPVQGFFSMLFLAFSIIFSFMTLSLFINERNLGPSINQQVMLYMSMSSPIPLASKLISACPNDLFARILQMHLNRFGTDILVLAVFLGTHLLIWAYACTGIIAGFPRTRFDMPKGAVPGKPKTANPLADPNSVNSQRSLNLSELKIFFQQNTFSSRYPRFEFVFSLMTSLLLCAIVALITCAAAGTGETSLQFIPFYFLLLIFLLSFTSCFSKSSVLRQKRPSALLLPTYFTWSLPMAATIAGTFYLHVCFPAAPMLQHSSMVVLAIFASFSFSLFSSINNRSYAAACIANLGCYAFLVLANFAAAIAGILIFFGWETLWSLRWQEGQIMDELINTPSHSTDLTLVMPVIAIAVAATSIAIAAACLVQSCVRARKEGLFK